MRYSFAPGVYGCLADGRLVLLNLYLDRYLMVPPEIEASLRRLLEGEPDAPSDRALRDRLCVRGLVLTRSDGPSPALCESSPVTGSLLDQEIATPPIGKLARAAVGTLQAAAWLRMIGLRRSTQCVASVAHPVVDDLAAVGNQAAAFAGLRLAVRSLDRCLPLSLALARTAKRVHGDVRLVLGVKCNPFGAHAWVQLGPNLLNDYLDAVRPFTPILVI